MIQEKKCRGGIYFSRISYVKEKQGKAGMDAILTRMKQLGYRGPTDEKEIKTMASYPMEYNILFLKAYRDIYGDARFRKLSRESPKRRGVVGTFLKWAASPELLIKKTDTYWKKFYLFGELKGEMVGPKKAVIKGYDVSPDPIFCDHLSEYFKGVFENININDIVVQHVSCVHEGDDHCEWILTWGDIKKDEKVSPIKTIKWDESLETGVEEIDNQHKYFVKILNEINLLVLRNHKTAVLRSLNFMDYYAHWHFSSEEKYMKEYDYPSYEYHYNEHKKFYAYTKNMMKKVEDSETIEEDVAHSIQKYLIDWLINHIKHTDRRFAEFLRVNNILMEEEAMPKEIADKFKEN